MDLEVWGTFELEPTLWDHDDNCWVRVDRLFVFRDFLSVFGVCAQGLCARFVRSLCAEFVRGVCALRFVRKTCAQRFVRFVLDFFLLGFFSIEYSNNKSIILVLILILILNTEY